MTTATPHDVTADTLPLEAIIVDDRIRENLGDIDALADSIKDYGLIQPVVVDESGTLIAGRRRLEAVKRLGWTDVPVRAYGTLTAPERLDIEIEENQRRDELTAYERSKMIARLAQLAREVALEETEDNCVDATQSTRRRRGSLRDIERRIGINEATIRMAERHVRVVEFYPELRVLDHQRYALDMGDLLDALPFEQRQVFLDDIAENPALYSTVTTRISRAIRTNAQTAKLQKITARAQRQQEKQQQAAGMAGLATAPTPTVTVAAPTPSQRRQPAAPALTPEQEEALAKQRLRGDYIRYRDEAWEMTRLSPKALRKVLEPGDRRENDTFRAKLREWLDAWE